MSATSSARIDALEANLKALRGIVDTLVVQRSPGPRDQYDEALVVTLAASTRGLSFTTAAVWRHRAVNVALAEALLRADIEGPKQLGRLLRRVEGQDVDAVRVTRIGANREGLVWRASLQV